MTRPPRRFGLLDAMILVSALACGLALMKVRVEAEFAATDTLPARPVQLPDWDKDEPIRSALRRAWTIAFWATPLSSASALGLLVVRLRKPRPPRGRMICQPGTAACLAVAVTLVLQVLGIAANAFKRYLEAREDAAAGLKSDTSFASLTWGAMYSLAHPNDQAYAIIVAWTILFLSGRLRIEKSAIDRLGRALGLYTILVGVVMYASTEP